MMLMIIGVKLHLNELNFALTNIFILVSSLFRNFGYSVIFMKKIN